MGKDASGIACQYKDTFNGSGKKGPNAWIVLMCAPDLDWDARVELTTMFNKKISEATNHMKFYDSNGGRISSQCNMAWPSVVVQMAKNECWKFQRDDQCLDDKCPWNHSIDGQKGDNSAWWNPHLNGIGGWDNHEAAKQRRGGKGGKGKGFKGAGKGGKKGGKGKPRAGKGVKGGKERSSTPFSTPLHTDDEQVRWQESCSSDEQDAEWNTGGIRRLGRR
jgi:hypothetical protein